MLLFVSGLLVWKGSLWKLSDGIVVGTTFVTLLASPYLLNYDFVLLLIPLIFLTGQIKTRLDWLFVGMGYFLPMLGVVFLGRQGNVMLILAAVILVFWLLFRENLLASRLPTLH